MTPEKDACTSESPIAGAERSSRPIPHAEEARAILHAISNAAEVLQATAEEAAGDVHHDKLKRDDLLVVLGRLQALGDLIGQELAVLGEVAKDDRPLEDEGEE